MGYYDPSFAAVPVTTSETAYPLSAKSISGYRYYMPEMGRWVSRDPMWESGGLNIYCFVRGRVCNAIDVLGLTECLIHFWVGHSSSVKQVLPSYKNDQCSRHAVFACNVDQYINKVLPPEVIIPPYPSDGVGKTPTSTWQDWAQNYPFYNPQMTYEEFQAAFVSEQIRAMRHEAATLALDPKFICKCKCDDIRIVVHKLSGYYIVPDAVKTIIQDIIDHPWLYHVSQQVKDDAKKEPGCCASGATP